MTWRAPAVDESRPFCVLRSYEWRGNLQGRSQSLLLSGIANS